ncbi:uncharacterized protein LOC132068784 [Lycium ferocissimum]|uniref:uncharacterized protein LOC132068784 n=1 Tax=Lycium ferocissimum TaxID=112874 RepID=UPI002814D505|nr:uncharacterized protein LOC132068784 [Lycium ferocissimum]
MRVHQTRATLSAKKSPVVVVGSGHLHLLLLLLQGWNLLKNALIPYPHLSKINLIPMESIGKVSREDTRNFYFGEFKKTYHWDSSIPESVIKKHWNTKAATKYRNFISKIKQKRIKPDYVSDNVWERWLQLWADLSVSKSRR